MWSRGVRGQSTSRRASYAPCTTRGGYRTGSPTTPSRLDPPPPCATDDCPRMARHGAATLCLKCWNRWRYNNDPAYKAKITRANRQWHDAHRNQMNEAANERYRLQSTDSEWRERRLRAVRDTHLRRKYGIGVEDYERMLIDQDYRCAICGQAETIDSPKGGQPANLAIDHEATTGRVRGLLCFRCNRAVGQVREDVTIAEALVGYLRHFST